ncbi:hypothetical protein [Streptomyces sp. NPDC006274]|uniref:hypothetical protein n=1 Tax=unclassified Streptomyces TaxID=2593676 RepID=UPI00339EF80F
MTKSRTEREDPRREVLRRKSFSVLSWTIVLAMGLGAVGATDMAVWSDDPQGPLTGVALCFATIALVRRVLCARVVLDPGVLRVVNPLFTYVVPYRLVSEVGTGKDGTLKVRTTEGGEIYATGFGGSLLDHFVGSADRAAERLREVARQRRGRRDGEAESARRTVTVSWVGDVCLVTALGVAVAAVVSGG